MYARLGNIYIYISKCRFLFARVDIRFVTRRNSERGGGGCSADANTNNGKRAFSVSDDIEWVGWR